MERVEVGRQGLKAGDRIDKKFLRQIVWEDVALFTG